MMGRCVATAGVAMKLGNHSFRATGIIRIKKTAARSRRRPPWRICQHAHDTAHDRRRDEFTLDEVERVAI
jgi:hypothetical protein